MNVRGFYGHSGHGRALVGTTLFHGLADRDAAAAQINTQLQTIASAVVRAAGGDPSLLHSSFDEAMAQVHPDPYKWALRVVDARTAMEKSPLLPLWDNAVSPLLTEWNTFHSDRSHWYNAFTEYFTGWEDYASWFERVNALRDAVEAQGVSVPLPRMQALTESVQDKAEQAVGQIWKIAKFAVCGALGVAAVIAISIAYKNVQEATKAKAAS